MGIEVSKQWVELISGLCRGSKAERASENGVVTPHGEHRLVVGTPQILAQFQETQAVAV